MADVTGANTTSAPIISNNTNAVLRHRTQYYNGTGSIDLPLKRGTRYVIYGVITAGATISIGFGQAVATITDSRFTFTQGSGPLDLSLLFNSAPFAQYREPTDDYVYLSIVGTGAITAAVAVLNS